jgi:hypothetical protein
MLHTLSRAGAVLAVLVLLTTPAQAYQLPSFAPGDLFISTESGLVQWRSADGSLRRILVPTAPGTAEGIGFDSAGNLYVGRWSIDDLGLTGNTVEKYNVFGQSVGTYGRGYDCAPRVTTFDAAGNAYVSEAGCRGAILKFAPGASAPSVLAAAQDVQGVFWMDLGPDGCTMFYTSMGANVKRFDVCTGVQLPDFNVAPLPGGSWPTMDVRVLPDGGVLVASGSVIARLDSVGALVRTYQSPAEEQWIGLDLVGDGTFWVGAYYSSSLYRFDLETGEVLATLSTGMPPNSVVGVRVKK